MKRTEDFEHYRVRWLFFWILCNSAFFYFINITDKEKQSGYIYLSALAGLGAIVLLIRFVGCVMFLVKFGCRTGFDSSKQEYEDSDIHMTKILNKMTVTKTREHNLVGRHETIVAA